MENYYKHIDYYLQNLSTWFTLIRTYPFFNAQNYEKIAQRQQKLLQVRLICGGTARNCVQSLSFSLTFLQSFPHCFLQKVRESYNIFQFQAWPYLRGFPLGLQIILEPILDLSKGIEKDSFCWIQQNVYCLFKSKISYDGP